MTDYSQGSSRRSGVAFPAIRLRPHHWGRLRPAPFLYVSQVLTLDIRRSDNAWPMTDYNLLKMLFGVRHLAQLQSTQRKTKFI